jgi:EAL domain-containing protein (putative c-di-GMP-specific phosphodiesterase class I)
MAERAAKSLCMRAAYAFATVTDARGVMSIATADGAGRQCSHVDSSGKVRHDMSGGTTIVTGQTLVDDPELRAQLMSDLVPSSTRRGAVLVVETDPERPVTKVLQDAGFFARSVEDGVVATQILASSTFDAVLSDLSAHGLGGLELLRFVREHEIELPVLLMTGAPDVETAAEAVEHGAFQYLLKPVATPRLVGAVDKAVRVSRAGKSRRGAIEDPETSESGQVPERVRWDNALARLWMAYQPIVLPGGKLYGYEALVRSDEPALSTASDIIEMAEKLGDLRGLGRRVREAAGRFAVRTDGRAYLFVNLHADDLLDELLASPTQPLAQVAPAVVLEITERAALHDVEEAKVKMAELRSMGFRIALDDLGAGYAGLTSFAHLRPEIVKLDMALVRGVDRDPLKRKIIGSVSAICRDMGTLVVGEGVETAEEREALVELGCGLLQGYLFGRPQRL